MITHILSRQGLRARIELLLRAQRCLGGSPGTLAQRGHIARAIAELHAACPTPRTEAVELWASEYLRGLG